MVQRDPGLDPGAKTRVKHSACGGRVPAGSPCGHRVGCAATTGEPGVEAQECTKATSSGKRRCESVATSPVEPSAIVPGLWLNVSQMDTPCRRHPANPRSGRPPWPLPHEVVSEVLSEVHDPNPGPKAPKMSNCRAIDRPSGLRMAMRQFHAPGRVNRIGDHID